MMTLLFVHGTGVREEGYRVSLDLIEKKVASLGLKLLVKGCYWGAESGARLELGGASIPTFASTGGEQQTEEEEAVALWRILYSDPCYELRVLRLKPTAEVFGPPPGDALIKQLKKYSPSVELTARFHDARLADHLKRGVAEIAASPELAKAAMTAPAQPLEHRQAIGRAIVAQTIVLAENAGVPDIPGAQRDELVKALSSELGAYGLGIGRWLKNAVKTLAAEFITRPLVERRGALSDKASPIAGDILKFLADPVTATGLLRATLADLVDERVVLLGHSLGGVMCVDLLAREEFSHVEGLITVGSQSPYFFEIGALPAVQPGKALPQSVPRWLNIYDLRDGLSYIGAEVFPGRVTDVGVDNGQPFPQSHSAYWNNPATWTEIAGFLA
ncbi:hypothetical protein AU252_11470 [Pseudarthrobacter sulfonivorans]|uniref:Uncharacterized protein n=1 Tax=Pseudarthrobacter sulfonivorans TaxID=121292 RepID=A0A0U3QBD6_9MICC|nr:hypothetical protein [Pseudarthrobacter sulfonivorans]ALV41693.1 hypothetical protein AU252_11470 [Pseudarthrobacter sulfonivorans]